MNKADAIITLALIRQIELQQVATWMLRDMIEQLRSLEHDVIFQITKIDPNGVMRPSARKAREAKLLEKIDDMIREVMRELAKRTEADFEELTDITEKDENNNWLLIYGSGLVFTPVEGKPTIAGTRVRDYFDKMADDLSFNYGTTIRESIEGEGTAAEIAARVAGQTDLGVAEISVASRTLETTVRTGVDSIPSEAETRAEPESPIGPHGWQHVSVLDSRTTQICRGRAWKRWDANYNPIGHDLTFAQPPLHPNCRSVIKMVFLDDPEPERLTFKGFMDRLTTAQQNKLFGAQRIELWRTGKITDAQLIRQQGKALSIDQLRQRTESKGQTEFPYL